jgi:hypothetical protein
MSDPISTIIIAGAAGGGASKLVEKAWESGEKWLATFFKDHHARAVEKAKDNSKDFLNKLTEKVAQLEERQQVDRAMIDRALEEPSFGVILQKALIGSSQTESEEKHELLAKLVTMKLVAPQESWVGGQLLASARRGPICPAIRCAIRRHAGYHHSEHLRGIHHLKTP